MSSPLNTLHCACTSPPGCLEGYGKSQADTAVLMTCQIWLTCLPMSSHDFRDGSSRAGTLTTSYANFLKAGRDEGTSKKVPCTAEHQEIHLGGRIKWETDALFWAIDYICWYIWSSFFKRDRLIWNMVLDKKNLKVPSWIFKITLQEARKSYPFCIQAVSHNAIMLMFAEGRGRITQPQRHFRKELVTLLQGRIARVPRPWI